VAVRADKTLKYGQVVEVLDWCRAAGFEDVRLATARADQAR
jgi:biopolymer transport protein ExbD